MAQCDFLVCRVIHNSDSTHVIRRLKQGKVAAQRLLAQEETHDHPGKTKGKLLVTNHDEPEAVIIAVAEYDALMHLVEQSKAQTESAVAGLRQSFDERLSVLQGRSATARLQSTIRGHAKLGGKVKAGSGY